MKKQLIPQDELYRRLADERSSVQVHFRTRPTIAFMLKSLAEWGGLSKTTAMEYLIRQAYADAEDGSVLAFEDHD